MHNRILRLPVMLVIIGRGYIDGTFPQDGGRIVDAPKKVWMRLISRQVFFFFRTSLETSSACRIDFGGLPQVLKIALSPGLTS